MNASRSGLNLVQIAPVSAASALPLACYHDAQSTAGPDYRDSATRPAAAGRAHYSSECDRSAGYKVCTIGVLLTLLNLFNGWYGLISRALANDFLRKK